MAPNSHYCGDGGRQSMMPVPSLVLIPADNPNDFKVLCNGKKCVNLLPDSVKKPPPVPAINVLPPSPRTSSNRRKWANNDQKEFKVNTSDENNVHDWSMEEPEHIQSKVSSKCQYSNTFVNNKNVTPFIIRRSPLKQVPSSKAEEIGPTQFGGVCKLNFNQISVSDESEGSTRTPATPEVKQVFFSSSKYNTKADQINDSGDICDEVFDDIRLTSPPDITPNSKLIYGSNGSEVDSNNNSERMDDSFYNVTGEDWPPIELTPEQEEERFKIFCDKKFRESGGVTPVIVGMIPKSLPGGPTIRLPGVSAQYSYTGGMTLNRNIGNVKITPAAVHPVNSGLAAVDSKNEFEVFSDNISSEQNKYEKYKYGKNVACCNNDSPMCIIPCTAFSLKGKLQHKLVKQPRNSSSFVTPPAQTWHGLALKQNVPTPSPSKLIMQLDSTETVPLWTTPAVIKRPHTQVLTSNNYALENYGDTYLDHPYSTDIDNYHVPSLWSTPAILNADSSQQVVLRTPASVRGGVYSSFTQGSHYSSLTKRRNNSIFQNEHLEKEQRDLNEKPSTAPLSYMGVITNIFKSIFGGLDKVDIPVIYPHYEVANGTPTVEIEKKND